MKSENIIFAEREADRSLEDFEQALEGLNTQITHLSGKAFELRDRAMEMKDRALVFKDKLSRPRELIQEAVGVNGEEAQARFNETVNGLATRVQDQVKDRVTTTVQNSLGEAQTLVDQFTNGISSTVDQLIFQSRAQAEEALASLDRRPIVNALWIMMCGVAIGSVLSRRFAGTRSIGGAVAAAPENPVFGGGGITTSDVRERRSRVA